MREKSKWLKGVVFLVSLMYVCLSGFMMILVLMNSAKYFLKIIYATNIWPILVGCLGILPFAVMMVTNIYSH